jgi:DNA topoisomerase I
MRKRGQLMKKKESIKNLVIVESPSKATTIEKYLGKDYAVTASKGHICDLSLTGKGHLGIDVDNDFKTSYTISKDKKETVKQLKEMVKNADNVLLATDPDREGEAIAYHLANNLGIDLNQNNRVVFHEVTKPAVTQAIQQPRQVDMNLVNSQETRRILDRIIGFKLSSLLYSKIKSRSAGRVQSVALKLIVDREEEINEFVPQEYWTVAADFNKDDIDFTSELSKIDGQKPQISSKEEADKVVEDCSNKPFTVKEIVKEVKPRKPRPAYTTSTLQQDAANKLYFTSKKTMTIAQKLYEGVNIGSSTTGLITYMRTDSTRLSELFLQQGKQYIKNTYGDKYVGTYHSKTSKNAQDAHEAIRVTDINNQPDKIKSYLTNDEYKLYKLIYIRTLAAMMADALYDSETVSLEYQKYLYTASGKSRVFDGYLKVYPETDDDKVLPELKESETIIPVKVEGKQHFTEPPARYSEARLIKTMEENGIGRPSTYATIIDTIIKREYVSLTKQSENSKTKVFVPTEQGILTTHKLDEFFKDIINVKYTAEMEKQLDEIAEGQLDKVKSLREFYDSFIGYLDNAKEHMEKIEPVKVGRTCPECGQELVIRKGKYGQFIACSNYPECKYHENINDDADEVDHGTCPECGSKLVEKRGRFGKFIACSNYPTCHYIAKKAKTEPVDTGRLCPECGNKLVERVSRYGTKFIGCSNYPKCHYIEGSQKKKASAKKVKKNVKG